MSDAELENFIQKFKQLRKAGVTAHLDLDTHAGQAWVGLKVMLNSAEQRETMTKWKTKTEWKTKTDLKTKS